MTQPQKTTGPARPRLLIVSYALSPYRGSEAGAGWWRTIEMAKYYDTWVLCEEGEYGPDLERYQREGGSMENLHFVCVRKPWEWAWGRKPWGYFAYNFWHRRAYARARQLHAELKFDCAFQTTMCGYREPGYSWKLGIPWVWGPLGGTQDFPWSFVFTGGLKCAAFETLRSTLNWIQLRTSLKVRRAARVAKTVMAANSTMSRDFARVLGVKTLLLSDIAIKQVNDKPRTADNSRPLRILWSGVLEHRKALPVLLNALALIKDEVAFEVSVLGTGPCDGQWKQLSQKLGLADRVVFHGHLPHAEAMRQNEQADLFAFTSLRDTSGNVITEALAAGLPIVCFDHQGVGDIVTQDCGIKIPVTAPREAYRDWADAIRRLAAEPALREQLSRGALVRARDFLRTTLGLRLKQVIDHAMGIEPNGAPAPAEQAHTRNGKSNGKPPPASDPARQPTLVSDRFSSSTS